MARTPWVFTDPIDSSSYNFEVNPLEANSPTKEKTITEMPLASPGGTTLLFEGADKNAKMSISGTLLSQTQYDALNTWYEKRSTILVTTDIGQVYTVYVVRLNMTRVNNRSFPYKHKFSIDFVVMA